jgi:hypothetical protein
VGRVVAELGKFLLFLKLETGNWKLESGDWNLETGIGKLEFE